MTDPVRILYRPVGPKELALIEGSGYREFPPRLPEQPIFYPVTNEEYARHIAEKWNVKESGSGYVTRFAAREDFIARYPVQQVGTRVHTEHWIPAEELPEFNHNIVGLIEVIASFERTCVVRYIDDELMAVKLISPAGQISYSIMDRDRIGPVRYACDSLSQLAARHPTSN